MKIFGLTLVHCLGFNSMSKEIIDYCKKRKIFLIEDCCELYVTFKGIGTLYARSLFGHHIITIEGADHQ